MDDDMMLGLCRYKFLKGVVADNLPCFVAGGNALLRLGIQFVIVVSVDFLPVLKLLVVVVIITAGDECEGKETSYRTGNIIKGVFHIR